MEVKSKTELYLQRLNKWREQKKKQPLAEVHAQHVQSNVKRTTVGPNSVTLQTSSTVKPKINKKPTVKPTKVADQISTGQPSITERLKLWREEKKKKELENKAKKHPAFVSAASAKKTAETSKPVLSSGQSTHKLSQPYSHVKSRLFSSAKSESKGTNSNSLDRLSKNECKSKRALNWKSVGERHGTSRISHDHGVIKTFSSTLSRSKSTSQCTTSKDKHTLKRRHSEVVKGGPVAKKPASILKRKSCFASFSEVNVEENAIETERTDGHASKYETNEAESDRKSAVVRPVATVTPGVSTRNVRFISPEPSASGMKVYRKTPNTNTSTSMRHQLNDWLVSKGKTPSKFRHLMCFDAEMCAKKMEDPKMKNSLTVDELTEQQEAMEKEENITVNMDAELEESVVEETEEMKDKLDTVLQECMTLFDAGCPTDDIIPWMDSIFDNIPFAKTSAQYYINKAKVFQSTGDLDAVLGVFEMAITHNAQPSETLASSVREIITTMCQQKEKKSRRSKTPKRRSEVQESNMFESSAVKYSVSKMTPFSDRVKTDDKVEENNSSPCAVITPVRRSTRRSHVSLPDALKDTSVVDSLDCINDKEKDRALFKPNMALDSLFAQAEEED